MSSGSPKNLEDNMRKKKFELRMSDITFFRNVNRQNIFIPLPYNHYRQMLLKGYLEDLAIKVPCKAKQSLKHIFSNSKD